LSYISQDGEESKYEISGGYKYGTSTVKKGRNAKKYTKLAT
jgi:hypothetical protein